MLRLQRPIVFSRRIFTGRALHIRYDVPMKMCIVVPVAFVLMSAMFALINRRKIAAMLLNDCFNSHGHAFRCLVLVFSNMPVSPGCHVN